MNFSMHPLNFFFTQEIQLGNIAQTIQLDIISTHFSLCFPNKPAHYHYNTPLFCAFWLFLYFHKASDCTKAQKLGISPYFSKTPIRPTCYYKTADLYTKNPKLPQRTPSSSHLQKNKRSGGENW